MGYILLGLAIIIGIPLLIFYSIYTNNVRKSTQNHYSSNYSKPKKSKELKEGFHTYPIRGWNHYIQNHNLEVETFIGKAILDHNKHDFYSIAITYENKIIGYLPKTNNHSLYNFIKENYKGTIFCFGKYDYDRTQITIPLFANNDILNSLYYYFTSFDKLLYLQQKQEKEIDDYFSILETDLKIQNLLTQIPESFNPDYRFVKKYLNEFSIILNKSNDYSNLSKLKNYELLINQLSNIDQEKILKKIDKAENFLLKNSI